MEENAKTLTSVLKEAKALNMKASLNKDVLRINREKFTIKNIHELPTPIRPEILANHVTEDEHFFYGRNSRLYNCHFDDGFTHFNC